VASTVGLIRVHFIRFLYLLFAISAVAGEGALGAVEIEENRTVYSLGPSLEFFEDTSSNLNFEKIVSPLNSLVFNPVQRDFPNMGFTESTYWFRTKLINHTNFRQQLLLEETSSWIDSIKLYTPSASIPGQWDMVHVGDKLPFNQRKIDHQDFLLPISLEAGQVMPVYLRVQSKSLMMMSLTLWKQASYDAHSRTTALFFGVLFGIFLITFLYNLFIYISVKDSAYLYYILFVLSAALMAFTSNGFSYMYLWPDSNWMFERMQIISISLMQVFGILFTSRFLDTHRHLPRMHRVLQGFLWVHGAIILLMPFVTELVPFAKLVVIAALIYSPLLFLVGVLALIRGVKPAFYFLLGWSSSVIGIIISVLTVQGVFEYSLLTYNATFIGVVVDISLLSVALADRINMMRRENLLSKELLNNTLRKSRDDLELKVQERTTEMTVAKESAVRASAAKNQF